MKTNYLLVAFIAATALFFWLASNFSQIKIVNPFVFVGASSTPASNGNNPGTSQSFIGSSSTFQGPPPGKPGAGFIGPKSPPPNY